MINDDLEDIEELIDNELDGGFYGVVKEQISSLFDNFPKET